MENKKAKEEAPTVRNYDALAPTKMHIGRDWSEGSWRQAFKAQCKKWDRVNSKGKPRGK